MERRVLREDLRSPEPSPDVDSDTGIKLRLKQLGELHYDFDIIDGANGAAEADEGNEDEEAIDFRLFGPASTNGATSQTAPAQKIRLHSPSIDAGEPGFLTPRKDESYYLVRQVSPETRSRFDAAAVSGGEVLARSHSAWPGASYPWKVLHLPVSGLTKAAQMQNAALFAKLTSNAPGSKRTRPGKKTRMRKRSVAAAALAKQVAAQQSAEAKEAEEREKRTRRNREKKVKKKARDKAKKGDIKAGESQSECHAEAASNPT